MNIYKFSCIATALVFVALFVQLMFTAETFISDMGLVPSETACIIAQRTAIIMLGISILLFSARNLPHSDARQYICISTGFILAGLACNGIYEFNRGTVNFSIFTAITIESVLGLLFIITFIRDRRFQIITAIGEDNTSREKIITS